MSERNSQNNVAPGEPKEKKYALVVGVNESRQMPELGTLKCAENDARSLAGWLGEEACGFNVVSPGLIGKGASTQAVRQAIVDFISEKSQEDLLLFYFVGHGVEITTTKGVKEVFLVTADFDPRYAKKDSGLYISLNWLRSMLYEENHSASVVCILDCCESGKALRSLPYDEQKLLQYFARLVSSIKQEEQAPQSPNRLWAIIASSRGTAYEQADESGKGHTQMTGLVLDILTGKDTGVSYDEGDLTVLELYSYLERRMQASEFKGQIPLMDGEIRRRWVLVHQIAENHMKRSRDDFIPSQLAQAGQAGVPHMQRGFDQDRSRVTFEDLNFEEVRKFLRSSRVGLQDDFLAGASDYRPDTGRHERRERERKQMEGLGLLDGREPTHAALLCFGKGPSLRIGGAYIRCIRWKGPDGSHGCDGPVEEPRTLSLLQQHEAGCAFLKRCLEDEISEGEGPEKNRLYMRVLEEALANALIHREYVAPGRRPYEPRDDPVIIEIFSNRVVIASPGYSLISIDDLKAESNYKQSLCRNPSIQRIFYLAGYVERTGYGIDRIKKGMREAGLAYSIDLYPQNQPTHQPQTFVVTLARPATMPAQPSLPSENGGAASDHLPAEIASSYSDGAQTAISSVQTDVSPGSSSTVQTLPPNPPTNVGQTPVPRILAQTAFVPSPEPASTPGGNTSSAQSEPDTHASQPVALPQRRFAWFFRPAAIAVGVTLCLLLLLFSSIEGVLYLHGLVTPTPSTGTAGTSPPVIEIASDFALDDLPLQNGVQMAIDQMNTEAQVGSSGYSFKRITFQDVNDNQLIGMIGPDNSTIAQTELPEANQASLALLSPNTTFPCLTQDSRIDPACSGPDDIAAQMRPAHQLTYFRLAAPDNLQGQASADYFLKTRHYHTVLLLKDDSDPYSRGLAEAFNNEWTLAGGQAIPVDLQTAEPGVSAYQHTLQSLTVPQLDLIYFAGGDPAGKYVLQALAKIPTLKDIAFASDDEIMDSTFLQAASQLHRSAPVYASLPLTDPNHANTPRGLDFRANYAASGYRDYSPYAAAAYDCTMILIQAIKDVLQADSSLVHGGVVRFREAVLQKLRQTSYSGATGLQGFDDNGDTTNRTISFYWLNISQPQPNWQWLQQSSV